MRARRGDIWWVDFGSTRGSEQSGQRPALVIQNDIGNEHSSTTIVAAITSQIKKPYPVHVEISSVESGLSKEGTILLEQLLTISESRLIRQAGKLSKDKMKEVGLALRASLHLNDN